METSTAATDVLSGLDLDTVAVVGKHLDFRDIANLAVACKAVNKSVLGCESLWSHLCQLHCPLWHASPACTWRGTFLQAHQAAHQLCSSHPALHQMEGMLPFADSLVPPSHLSISTDATTVFGTQHGRMWWWWLDMGVILHSHAHRSHTGGIQSVVEVQAGEAGYVTGGDDTQIRLWPLPRSAWSECGGNFVVKPLRSLRGHSESITCMTLIGSEERPTLASGSVDRTIKLWSLAPLVPAPADHTSSHPLLTTLRGHGDRITCLIAQTDSQKLYPPSTPSTPPTTLISGAKDCRVKMWDAEAAACAATWKLQEPCLKLLPGAGDQDACLWAVQSSRVAVVDRRVGRAGGTVLGFSHSSMSRSRILDADAWGMQMCTGTSKSGAQVWDIRRVGDRNSCPVFQVARGELVNHVHMDRVKLVTAAVGQMGPTQVWSADSGELLTTVFDPSAPEEGDRQSSWSQSSGETYDVDSDASHDFSPLHMYTDSDSDLDPLDDAALPVLMDDAVAGSAQQGQGRGPRLPLSRGVSGWEQGVGSISVRGLRMALAARGTSGAVLLADFSKGGPTAQYLQPPSAPPQAAAGAEAVEDILGSRFWQVPVQ